MIKEMDCEVRHFAEKPTTRFNNNGNTASPVCTLDAVREDIAEEEMPPNMKTSLASKRVMQRLRNEARLAPTKPLPSDKEIDEVERKILADQPLTKNDTPAVMAILKRFSKSARIVRTLAKTEQRAAALALGPFLRVTIQDVQCLEKLPVKKLRYFAAPLTAFPMLVAMRQTSQKRINKRMAELELGSEVAPGYTVNSRWKKDAFARVAEELLVDVYGGPPSSISLEEWNEIWPKLHGIVATYLKDRPSVLEDLLARVTAASDAGRAGRGKARVIDNIRVRMRAILGLKGLRSLPKL